MSVHLVTGDDESIVRAAVTELVHRLLADGDRSLMVDEFDGDDYELRSVVDAAQTPPFLTERRVVVARGIGRFTADDLPPLVGYLHDPLPTTDLVLVVGGGRVVKPLSDAIKASGAETIGTAPPSRARDREAWIQNEASARGVKLSAAAVSAIAERLGEDVGRLDGILATLSGTFGSAHQLRPEEVEPFLGEAGDVPPWELTDALDAGNTSAALGVLARMTQAGARHPLQVMAVLHNHYARLAKLDGVDARSDNEAANALGIKPGFPAKKALRQYRRLGGSGVQRAIDLLATADLDLRGAKELPDDVVMDVLVARLSRLAR